MKGKRMQSLIKKNKKLIIAASLLASLVVGETYAWVASSLTVDNELIGHTTQVEVVEDKFYKGENESWVTKEVYFENRGSSAVFLRMSYQEYWEYNDQLLPNSIPGASGATGADVATKVFNAKVFQPSDEKNTLWLDGGDGWYYYTKVLPAGGKTDEVLKQVKFPTEYAGEYAKYKDAEYHLYFKVEAVQASTSPKTLNRDDVNAKATAKVFGDGTVPWAQVDISDSTVQWEFKTPYQNQGREG